MAVMSACVGRPPPIVPDDLDPIDREEILAWLEELRPTTQRIYRIDPWRYRNERGAAGGRAAIRIAPPDSLRLDYSGPFGRSGTAAVVGDSALWVVPEEDFSGLVALAPIFWTALGMPPVPPSGSRVFGLNRADSRVWRYIVGRDTLNFVLRGSPPNRLDGEVRRAGQAIGVAEVTLDPETGLARSARIDLPTDRSRFEFTVQDVDTLASFDATIWRRP
jgi:hypothetical protein